MNDFDILKELFQAAAIVKMQDNYSSCRATLTEVQSPDSSVEITGIPHNTIIVKIDKFPEPSKIFKGDKGECKRADYAVFSTCNNKNRILIIEMKRTKDGKAQIIKQLKGARCAVEYCRLIVQSFWNRKDFLDTFEYRFISFGHTSIRKRKTRITRQSGTHNSPEKMMKIDWPANIRFNHLAGA